MKIYLIIVKIPRYIYQRKYNYLFKSSGNNIERFRLLQDEDMYTGLYAWSNKKNYISDFLEFRNLSRVKYKKETIEIDKIDFDEFKSRYKLQTLEEYEIMNVSGNFCHVIMSKEEYLNITDYASENLFEFVDEKLYKHDYYILKGKYIDALDIVSYTANFDSRTNCCLPFLDSYNRCDISDNMLSYGLTPGGHNHVIKYYESTMTVFYLLFHEMIC